MTNRRSHRQNIRETLNDLSHDSSARVTPSITAFDLVVLKDWRDVSLFCKHSQRRLQEKDWDEAI